MRTFGDSITASDIPTTVDGVLVYLDGAWAWSDGDRALFAGKPQVEIVTNYQTNAGTECDVETGDLTPQQALWWVQMRRRNGVPMPTVYCAESSWPYIRSFFQQNGEPEPLWHIAGYDDSPVIPAGAVAKQYANQPLTGGHYDLSVVADYWPGVDTGGSDLATGYPAGDQAFFDRIDAIYNYVKDIDTGGISQAVQYLRAQNDENTQPRLLAEMGQVAAIKAELDAIKAEPVGTADAQTVATIVARIEKALQSA